MIAWNLVNCSSLAPHFAFRGFWYHLVTEESIHRYLQRTLLWHLWTAEAAICFLYSLTIFLLVPAEMSVYRRWVDIPAGHPGFASVYGPVVCFRAWTLILGTKITFVSWSIYHALKSTFYMYKTNKQQWKAATSAHHWNSVELRVITQYFLLME